MALFDHLQPFELWKYFAEISRIPRGSKNEAAAAKYVLDAAERLGLSAKTDTFGNVVVRKPASANGRHHRSIALRGVCNRRVLGSDGDPQLGRYCFTIAQARTRTDIQGAGVSRGIPPAVGPLGGAADGDQAHDGAVVEAFFEGGLNLVQRGVARAGPGDGLIGVGQRLGDA